MGISHNSLIRVSDFYRDQQGHNYVFGRKFNASQADVEDMGPREIHGRTFVLRGALLTTIGWCGPNDILLTTLSAAKLAVQDRRTHPTTQDSMFDAV